VMRRNEEDRSCYRVREIYSHRRGELEVEI
jgi:hypothetical protein